MSTNSIAIPGPTKPIIQPPSISTPRLILSQLQQSDLADCHRLRSCAETMYFTVTGRVDADEAATQEWLDRLLLSSSPSRDHVFSYAVRVKPTIQIPDWGDTLDKEEKGTFIGQVSIRPPSEGRQWPAIGYAIEPPYCGKGYGTEAVAACVKAWWELPRRDSQSSRPEQESEDKEEILEAWLEQRNEGSKKILARCGFEMVKEYYAGEDWRGPATLQDWHMRRPKS